MITTPVIIVNFKTYPSATGEKAVELAKICEKVSNERGILIVPAVQAADIYRVSNEVMIPVMAQHIDFGEPGRNTGKTLAETVKANGAVGTLINHSEDRVEMDFIEKAVKKASEVGLQSCVCVETPEEAEQVSNFKVKPDFIAIEPPELIGGDISISTAKPELISEAVDKSQVTILAGAGVKNGADVRKTVELNGKGILVASGVTKAKNPEAALLDLADGFK